MSIAVAEHEISVHDLSSDRYITLSRACRQLPKKPAPSTLWRWRVDGVKIKGRKIKLRCVRIGGKWYTTEFLFSEFLREQTDAALAVDTSVSTSERPQETERRLGAAGLI